MLSVIVLIHHARKIDDTKEFDKIVGWMELCILEKMQYVRLGFPTQKPDRVVKGVCVFVKIR